MFVDPRSPGTTGLISQPQVPAVRWVCRTRTLPSWQTEHFKAYGSRRKGWNVGPGGMAESSPGTPPPPASQFRTGGRGFGTGDRLALMLAVTCGANHLVSEPFPYL